MINQIKYNWKIISIFGLIAAMLVVNAVHFFYQDEFENILGGYYITQGKLPYLGFFTHHAPFAYFLASAISLISGSSFVIFRLLYAAGIFITFIGFYIYFKRKFGPVWSKLLLGFLILLSVSSTYFWTHMLLADSLAGYLITPAFMILVLSIYYYKPITIKDFSLITILLAMTFLTSFTYIYAVIILYVVTIYWFYSRTMTKLISKTSGQILIIIFLPYLIFGVYLLVTRSWNEFYFQAIFFNQEYYVKMPDGSSVRNPLRYAIVIFEQVFDRYRAVLLSLKDFNLGNPISTTLALSNLVLITYLIINKRFLLSGVIFLTMIYLCARVNPMDIQETNYQAIPYIFISTFNGIAILYFIPSYIKLSKTETVNFSFNLLFFLLGLFWFFSLLLLLNKDLEKIYTKYMGQLPLIYDRPIVASTLNQLLTSQDYYYIGPFDFQEQLYTHSNMASKYIVTIPAMDQSEKIKKEIIADFEVNKPKVVVFNTDDLIFGSYPGRFLLDFLKKNYFTMDQINKPQRKYNYSHNSFGPYDRYDFARHFFFRNDRKDEIIKDLIDNKLIIPI